MPLIEDDDDYETQSDGGMTDYEYIASPYECVSCNERGTSSRSMACVIESLIIDTNEFPDIIDIENIKTKSKIGRMSRRPSQKVRKQAKVRPVLV